MFCKRFFKTFLQQNNIFIIYENEFFAFYCYKAILQHFSQRFHFKKILQKNFSSNHFEEKSNAFYQL